MARVTHTGKKFSFLSHPGMTTEVAVLASDWSTVLARSSMFSKRSANPHQPYRHHFNSKSDGNWEIQAYSVIKGIRSKRSQVPLQPGHAIDPLRIPNCLFNQFTFSFAVHTSRYSPKYRQSRLFWTLTWYIVTTYWSVFCNLIDQLILLYFFIFFSFIICEEKKKELPNENWKLNKKRSYKGG